jgi:hypothetical protein
LDLPVEWDQTNAGTVLIETAGVACIFGPIVESCQVNFVVSRKVLDFMEGADLVPFVGREGNTMRKVEDSHRRDARGAE